jgi:hypothetical protein
MGRPPGQREDKSDVDGPIVPPGRAAATEFREKCPLAWEPPGHGGKKNLKIIVGFFAPFLILFLKRVGPDATGSKRS